MLEELEQSPAAAHTLLGTSDPSVLGLPLLNHLNFPREKSPLSFTQPFFFFTVLKGSQWSPSISSANPKAS